MKVVQVVPAVTRESSGPSYSVTRLMHALNQKGIQVDIATLDWGGSSDESAAIKKFPLR